MAKRCAACGKGHFIPAGGAGRRMRFKGFMLPLPDDLEIPTCDVCGEQGITQALAQKLDDALTEAYSKVVAPKINIAINKILKAIPSGEAEAMLGLSAGYLSRLLKGKQTSMSTAQLLLQVARDPEGYLQRLQQDLGPLASTPPRELQPR